MKPNLVQFILAIIALGFFVPAIAAAHPASGMVVARARQRRRGARA